MCGFFFFIVRDLSNNALSSTLEGTNGVFSGLAKLIML